MNDSWSRIKNFDSQWGSDDNDESKLKKFINQVLLISDTCLKYFWTETKDLEAKERRFCLLAGYEYDPEIVENICDDIYNDSCSNPFYLTHVYRELEKAQYAKDIKYLAKILLQTIFLVLEEKAKAIDAKN